MKVIVDGSEGWVEPGEGATLGGVLASLREEASRRRRALSVIRLDGEELSRERQDELAGRSAADWVVLEVRTLDPFRLSLDTISELRSHLRKMEETHEESARLVRGGKYDEATEKFGDCVAGWRALLNAVRDIARLTGTRLGDLRVGDKTVAHVLQYLQQTLLRFQVSFGTADVVMLGDIAEHELAPALKDWNEALDRLLEHVSGLCGDAGG